MVKRIIKMRKEINAIDRNIAKMLEKRMNISKKIGKIKRANKLAVRNIKRENEIINKLYGNTNLDKKFVYGIFNKIFEESRRMQR